MSMRLPLLLAAATAACSIDLPAPPTLVETSTGAETSPSSTGLAESSTTAGPEPIVVFDATFDLELRETIDVAFARLGTAIEVTVRASRGYGLVPTDVLVGVGRIDAYPELGATLYTATFDGPAQAQGPCADAPISLGLSLHHDDDASIIAGGLTGYCGAGTFFGTPAIEPLRIFGRLP